jgi:hypothetical protein
MVEDVGNAQDESAPTSSLFTGKVPIKAALKELRLRLLDLTGRNRLINFRHTAGRSLQFVESRMESVFERLIGDQGAKVPIIPLPEPEREAWVSRNGRLVRPDPRDFAISIGVDPSYDLTSGPRGPKGAARRPGAHLGTLLFAEDLGRHGRKLEREARSAIEETGANMLYLVFGFLEFPESPDSEKLYQAPLVCLPVSMVRTEEGRYSSFHLVYTGEELTENLSLKEKVKRDFGLNLPSYDTESQDPVESYLAVVAEAVAKLPNWRVRPMMTLALLSFTNMLLVRDLDPEQWPSIDNESALLGHPLVKQVFEGRPMAGEARYAAEYGIDEHEMRDLPLIYDADSSQHSALIDVFSGRSLVIEGPPGTGKSQTITNLIAAAIRVGKKVLFVAEKLAALEVVKSRLDRAGLAPFVLELHSNKTSKKRVLEDLSKRLTMRIPATRELPELLRRQEAKRQELKAYADLMNSRLGNQLDLTLHQVMWRAELNRLRCGEQASAVQHLDCAGALAMTPAALAEHKDLLRYLSTQFPPIGAFSPEHPLWGFFPAEFSPDDDLPVRILLKDAAPRFRSFAQALNGATSMLRTVDVDLESKAADLLLSVLGAITPADSHDVAFNLLPKLFTGDDPDGHSSMATLQDLSRRVDRLREMEATVLGNLNRTEPSGEDEANAAETNLVRLRPFGLTTLNASELAERCIRLEQGIRAAVGALRSLKELARMRGLEFDWTPAGIKQLSTIGDVLESAPREYLHLMHPRLREPQALAALAQGVERLRAIRDEHELLSVDFHLDVLPSEDVLLKTMTTFREGDAWYRVFQKRWRDAVRVHRQMCREKMNSTAEQRQEDVARIRSLLNQREAWRQDGALQDACGPHFQMEQTPLEGLLSVARWVASADAALERVQVPSDKLDPVTLGRSALAEASGWVAALRKALGSVHGFEELWRDIVVAPPELHAAASGTHEQDWRQRINTATSVLQAMAGSVVLMKEWVRPGVAAEAGLEAVRLSAELPRLVREIADHQSGRALFEGAFAGRLTPLDSANAAHAYGRQVRSARLPAAVERLLLSPDCVANHERLAAFIENIDQGWADLDRFIVDISKYGRFDIEAWTARGGRSLSEFSEALAAKTEVASDNVGGLFAWTQYVGARERAVRAGLEAFVTRMECAEVSPDKLEHAFVYRFYATVAQSAFQRIPSLRGFSGRRHAAVRGEFAELDKEIIGLRGLSLAAECRGQSRPPGGWSSARVDEKTEMELLNHLIPQQRPRVPVRQMLRRAGRAIQELKPCFMMGPQAVAQFLAPGDHHFDIVVMDEASQLRPEEAIGAIARGSQLVVVGDPKQLPPTSFFSRTNPQDADGEETAGPLATSEAESILDVCTSHFQPVRTLRWHYRSRHESLIAFSNHNFYRGNLVVFPSPYPKSSLLGLRYQYVKNGVYDNQLNEVEARRVVDATLDHILNRPEDSLGVVTLNIKQRDLVAELLEARIRDVPEALKFRERWEAERMDLFVKNLENVQGDERDCIIVSTTFGKARGADVVRQNFGPISRDGGWRRLNVLFTRARKSVLVVSSMRPEDIVVDARTPEGTRALRNYLEYARTGVLPMERETGLPPESDFEMAVMDVLLRKGYEVEPQLGVAGFRLDIAVRHPMNRSGYLAAIECDGATYHSGVSVRDRDRIRQEVLEGLGWKGRIWRIWSTDWFRNPLAETERLLGFLQELKAFPVPDEYLVTDVAAEEKAVNDVEPPPMDTTPEEPEYVTVGEDEELEAEIGDLISYSQVNAPDQVLRVQLSGAETQLSMGIVAVTTPLGSMLLGGMVGETVVLRVPGKEPQAFVIQSIQRSPEPVVAGRSS